MMIRSHFSPVIHVKVVGFNVVKVDKKTFHFLHVICYFPPPIRVPENVTCLLTC